MADFNTDVEIMLFEGGSLCAALPSHEAAEELVEKIMDADSKALADQKPTFTLSLTPFEVGMALAAATSNESILGQNLGQKISRALGAKLQELGISLDGTNAGGGSVGSDEGAQPIGGDEPASQPIGDDAPTDGSDTTQDNETSPE